MGIIINGKEKYRLDNILKHNAKFNLIIGGRNIGKTYAVKEVFLRKAYESEGKEQFAYIRRWSLDLKRKFCENYFSDETLLKYIKKLTKGNFDSVVYWEEKFYFAKTNEKGKKERGYQIGQAFALSMQEHYKSLNYPYIVHGIYEEWITDKNYLPNEPTQLENLISTIERDKNFRLYMCGNTLTRVIPYVTAWDLSNFARQEKGTIDIYERDSDEVDDKGNLTTFKIAVENCAEIDYSVDAVKNGILKKKSGNMIKCGLWESNKYQNRDYDIRAMIPIYTVVFQYDNFQFLLRLINFENNLFWDVERKTTPIKDFKNQRIVGNKFIHSQLWTCDFTPLTNEEKTSFALIRTGHIVFCDDLTGTEFYKCLKELKNVE